MSFELRVFEFLEADNANNITARNRKKRRVQLRKDLIDIGRVPPAIRVEIPQEIGSVQKVQDFPTSKSILHKNASQMSPIPTAQPATANLSLRRKRRRCAPFISQEAARHALIQSSKMQAEGIIRIANAMEKAVEQLKLLNNIAISKLNAIPPTSAAQ